MKIVSSATVVVALLVVMRAVADLVPGPASFGPSDIVAMGDFALFSAPPVGGFSRELWRTDGTAAGTVLVGRARPRQSRFDIGDKLVRRKRRNPGD